MSKRIQKKSVRTLYLIFITLLFTASFVKGQMKVNGRVHEDIKTPIVGAGVYLICDKDTLMMVSDIDGVFNFNNIKSLKFSLKVRALGYGTYEKEYNFPNRTDIQLDTVFLKEEAVLLKNVVIKGNHVPVLIKEDTLEYDANAFKIRAEAKISDLLKLMPGLQVDLNGEVSSMGQKLVKVRVNGKDFFTGNVKEFVSKLPANIVSKVQVIDDYGNAANFLNLKNEAPKKLLNIVTKEGIDGGIFGDGALDIGTNNQYGAQANINFWKSEKQISAYGNANRQDNGVGKSDLVSFGASYNDKLSKNTTFKSSYRYTGSGTDAKTLTSIETILNQGVLYNQNNDESHSNSKLNSLSGEIIKKTVKDQLTINWNGGLSKSRSSSFLQSQQTGLEHLNMNNRSNVISSKPNLESNLLYTRKLAKPGRSLVYSLGLLMDYDKSDENRTDEIIYYNPLTSLAEKDSVFKRRIEVQGRHNLFSGSAIYSEPIKSTDPKQKKTLSLGYTFHLKNNNNHLSTFSGETPYPLLVDSLSNIFSNSFFNQEIILRYSFSKKGLRYSFGVKTFLSALDGEYQRGSPKIHSSVINLSPIASFYMLKNKTIYNLVLSQNIVPPEFTQLQSVPDTRNLQQTIIGNPNLKPTLNNNMKVEVAKTFRNNISFQSSVGVRLAKNKVTTNSFFITDALNNMHQEIHFLNTNGDVNLESRYVLTKIFGENKYNVMLAGNLNSDNNVYYSDNLKGLNKVLNFSQSICFSANTKRINSVYGVSYSQTNNLYTLGNANASTIRSCIFNTLLRVQLTESLSVDVDLNKAINSGYSFDNVNPLVINASVSKFIFKKIVSINLRVNDLLKEGNNQQRIFLGNTTTDTRTNQITRYFLFSIKANVSKF